MRSGPIEASAAIIGSTHVVPASGAPADKGDPIRIALVSNFWYRRGGLERVMLADARELEARGNKVGAFASAHALNEPSRHSSLFPPSVDHGALGRDRGSWGAPIPAFDCSTTPWRFGRSIGSSPSSRPRLFTSMASRVSSP